MSKHTPGPWTVSEVDGMQGMFHIPIFAPLENGGEVRVAEVQPFLNDGGDFCFTDQVHANAHLIAAAPEMLAMLERLSNGVYGLDTNPNLMNLIKKAKGEL